MGEINNRLMNIHRIQIDCPLEQMNIIFGGIFFIVSS